MKYSCIQCGNQFDEDTLVAFGDDWVCHSCKPMYVQKLREGVPTASGDTGASRTADGLSAGKTWFLRANLFLPFLVLAFGLVTPHYNRPPPSHYLFIIVPVVLGAVSGYSLWRKGESTLGLAGFVLYGGIIAVLLYAGVRSYF